jgi:hypothetical protein
MNKLKIMYFAYTIRCKLILGLTLTINSAAYAVEIDFKPIAEGVYAYIGDTDGRNYDNEGLNANIGLIITAEGAVLIDSGATFQSAKKIHDAAK